MNPYSMENFLDEMFPAVLIIAGIILALMIVYCFCKYLILVWEEKHKPRRHTLTYSDIISILSIESSMVSSDHVVSGHYKAAMRHLADIGVYQSEHGGIPKIVEKNIYSSNFEDIQNGKKTFELRRDKDDIQTGDILVLRELNGCGHTGRVSYHKVKGVFRDGKDFGLKRGYCIISI